MKKQTIRTIVIFLLIASIIFISLITASIITQIKESNIKDFYNNVQSCTITYPEERTVIIRMDDVGALNRYEMSKKITEIVLGHNKAIVLGVIPTRLEKNTISWLKSLKNNNQVEIALHGYEHTHYEFKDLDLIDAKDKIDLGIKKLYFELYTTPVTFIPPDNQYSDSIPAALNEIGIKILSAKQTEYEFDNNPAKIGYTIITYKSEDNNFVSANKIIIDCKASLDKRKICVILIHPQDYNLKINNEINPVGEAELINVLTQLDSLNAEYKTFKGILNCQN